MELLIWQGATRWRYVEDEPPTWVVDADDVAGSIASLGPEVGGLVIAVDTLAHMLHEGRRSGYVGSLALSPGDVLVAW